MIVKIQQTIIELLTRPEIEQRVYHGKHTELYKVEVAEMEAKKKSSKKTSKKSKKAKKTAKKTEL